jgi:hypothetical protein
VLFFCSSWRLNFGVKEAGNDLNDAADADKFSPTVDVNEETVQQTNINVGEPAQTVAMTKVLVDKSTQTDDLSWSYNLQFVLNHLLQCKMSTIVTGKLNPNTNEISCSLFSLFRSICSAILRLLIFSN